MSLLFSTRHFVLAQLVAATIAGCGNGGSSPPAIDASTSDGSIDVDANNSSCTPACEGAETCNNGTCGVAIYAPAESCNVQFINPGSGFFESQTPGAGGNFSKACTFDGKTLQVSGGNFGNSFSISVELGENGPNYQPAANALQFTSSSGQTYQNDQPTPCTLCFDGDFEGSLSCPKGTLSCTNENGQSCGNNGYWNRRFACPGAGQCPAGYELAQGSTDFCVRE